MPWRLIDSGTLATLTDAEVRVLFVLCGHVNGDWQCRPSVTRIATLTGLNRRSVLRAVKSLNGKRVIGITHGRGRNHSNTYTVNGDTTVTISGDKWCHQSTPNGDPSVPEKVTLDDLNGDPSVTPTYENREVQTKQQQSSHAAAGGGEVFEALKDRGVEEPKLSALCQLPGITVEHIERIASMARGGRSPVGLLIRKLERHAAAGWPSTNGDDDPARLRAPVGKYANRAARRADRSGIAPDEVSAFIAEIHPEAAETGLGATIGIQTDLGHPETQIASPGRNGTLSPLRAKAEAESVKNAEAQAAEDAARKEILDDADPAILEQVKADVLAKRPAAEREAIANGDQRAVRAFEKLVVAKLIQQMATAEADADWLQAEILLPADSPLRRDDFKRLWLKWIAYLSERGRKPVVSTLKEQIAACVEMGFKDASEAIHRAIACGWTGIFRPKSAEQPLSGEAWKAAGYIP